MKRISMSDKLFLIIDYCILGALMLVILYPLLYVVMSSFAAGPQNMTLYLIPKEWTLSAYKAVFEDKNIWIGYTNSLINVVLSTVLNLVMTLLCAYPLSRKEFKFGGVVMTLCMITMYFGGGLIPSYLLVRDLGLLNSRWALILPGAMSVYNMIVTRTYLQTSIPGDIWESAQMDGCGHFRYLLSMAIPLSKPILAVVALFCAVGSWNAYFGAMIYVGSRRELYPLALVLREILVINQVSATTTGEMESLLEAEQRKNIMKYAVIVVSSLPVMMIYPFVQKFFVKGVMIGSVKG